MIGCKYLWSSRSEIVERLASRGCIARRGTRIPERLWLADYWRLVAMELFDWVVYLAVAAGILVSCLFQMELARKKHPATRRRELL